MSPTERTMRGKRLATLLKTIAERHLAKQSETAPVDKTDAASGGASR